MQVVIDITDYPNVNEQNKYLCVVVAVDLFTVDGGHVECEDLFEKVVLSVDWSVVRSCYWRSVDSSW